LRSLPDSRSLGVFGGVVLAVVLVAVAAITPLRYIRPAYAAPPKLAPGTVKAELGSQTIDVSFGDKMMLVACKLSDSRLVPGRAVRVDLYWRTLAPMDRDYSIYLQLYDGAGKVVAREDTYPGGGAYATSQLKPGDEIHDYYTLLLSDDAAPGDGHLDVGLYEFPSLDRLQPFDGAHRALPSPNVASFRVFAPAPAPSGTATPAALTYANTIELAGYRLDSAEVPAGGSLSGGLYWRATGQPDRDYTIFVHLAQSGSPPVAQADAQPQFGAFPTALWRRGDEVYHGFALDMKPDTPPGEYSLLVGLYDQPSGRRLEVTPGTIDRIGGAIRRLFGRGTAPLTAPKVASVVVRAR
jgi:hypothetical protein